MKKNLKKALKMLTVSALLILSLGCFTSKASAAASEVKTLTKGKTYSVTGYYKVKSTKPSVASAKKTSSKNYTVTGLKKGKTTLQCYNKKGTLKNTIYLLVTNNKTFVYDTTAVNLAKGKTKTVKASTNMSNVTVKYASSKTSVATVNSSGKITAKKAGTATIKAKFYYRGEKVKTLKKTVNVYTSSYNTDAITLTAGDSKKVSAALSSNATVKYSSSDTSIATVNSKGKITAKKKGTTTICAKIYIGSTKVKTYKKAVTVKAASASTTSSINSSSSQSDELKKRADSYRISSTSVTLDKGKTASIYCGYANSNGNTYGGGDTFKWSSSNSSIASISASGNKCTITGKGKGTANVTCVVNGLTTYTCKVTGTVENEITVNGVTFDLNDFPKELTVGTSRGCLCVVPQSTINPGDITYVVANGKAEKLCDYTTANLHENYTQEYTTQYYVSDWSNMTAFVETSYQPDMYLKYRVEIYPELKTGSFPVSVYYQGQLLRTSTVTVTGTSDNAKSWRADIDEMEANAWTNGMSTQEKLSAITSYVFNNYSYTTDGATCNVGAAAVLFAARDLGLQARYRFVGQSYDYSGSAKGYGDEYYHLGMAFCSGHVCTVVTINGKDTIYEAQGHAG